MKKVALFTLLYISFFVNLLTFLHATIKTVITLEFGPWTLKHTPQKTVYHPKNRVVHNEVHMLLKIYPDEKFLET